MEFVMRRVDKDGTGRRVPLKKRGARPDDFWYLGLCNTMYITKLSDNLWLFFIALEGVGLVYKFSIRSTYNFQIWLF